MEEMEGKELSECSSGCESGWTMYLDQSQGNPWNPVCKEGGGDWEEGERDDDDDDDLSMISDASSGPPHFHEDDRPYFCHQCGRDGLCCCCCCFFGPASSLFASADASARKDGKRRKVEAEQRYAINYHPQQQQDRRAGKQVCDSLDDTASSPLLSFSQNIGLDYGIGSSTMPPVENVLELSYGFSATHFKGKASLEKHLSYLNPNSVACPVKRS